MLNIAITAAREAGRLLLQFENRLDTLYIERKSSSEIVTNADHAADKAILKILTRSFPDHAILSEESGLIGSEDAEYTWIIDPLDGTNNFFHGLPYYCVSIGLKHRNQMILGVVYAPSLDKLFIASKEDGAQLNGRRMRVSQRSQFQDCLLSTNVLHRHNNTSDSYLKSLQSMKRQKISGFRYSGALALDLAFVAAGYLDAAWTFNANIWDIAAGIALVKQAGGSVTEPNGKHDIESTGNILAANHKLLSKIIPYFTDE